jgi:hypothetical protein
LKEIKVKSCGSKSSHIQPTNPAGNQQGNHNFSLHFQLLTILDLAGNQQGNQQFSLHFQLHIIEAGLKIGFLVFDVRLES